MRVQLFNKATKALTWIEVLVVVFVLVLLALTILPSLAGSRKPTLLYCLNNLRQVGIAGSIWFQDHNHQFPWQVSVTNGGTLELGVNAPASHQFKAFSPYAYQPTKLVCPTDKLKHPATNFAQFSNQSLSYFINLDIPTNAPNYIFAGDRHIQMGGTSIKSGTVTLDPNASVEWTAELHPTLKPGGCLVFADGHAEVVRTNLSNKFQLQNIVNNRIAIP